MTAPLRVRGYAVEQLLGAGSSSDVWRARAISSGAPVALKRIFVADERQRSRALDEAALLAALDHPNLVRLHTVLELDTALVLVLDLAEAGSLADLLTARGRLTPGEVITAVAPVAAALAHLHDAGVVHGDVSAANILFTATGTPLLADVGVARLTGDDADAEASPAYVDPAVAAGFVPGAPSDVFMLAGVALHALTGAPPWPDPDPAAALDRAAAGVLDDVAERLAAADVPPDMIAVLARALAVDPPRRGTAAGLALDLAHSATAAAVDLAAGRRPAEWTGPRHAAPLPGGPPPTRLVARPRPVIPRPPARRTRAPVPKVLAGAAAVALLGTGLAWAGIRSTGHPETAGSAHGQPQVETPPPSGDRDQAPDWAAALRRLDAVRGRAFATHRPALLRNVYLPGPLLAADTATLHRLVPAGCRLVGVRTSYSAVRIDTGPDSAVISTTAALARSRLVCGREVRDAAAGTTARLRIVLRDTDAGVRIAAERRLRS
jgi:hypothetical protein